MFDIQKVLDKIRATDVCELLRRKFEAERMDRFFTIDDKFTFISQSLDLSSKNSMLLRFRGLDRKHYYNMLLLFSLSEIDSFSFSLQNQIRRVAENNIDKVVIWTKNPIDADIIHSLKLSNANIIYISKSELLSVNFISNFYPYGEDYNYAVVLNKLTDLLVIRLKKLFHLVLSEIAASSYDSEYASNKVGTRAIMDFEEEILEKTINHLSWLRRSENDQLEIAVDVGCGTGRHSLLILRKYFKNIYGFDFSPKMIEIANQKKRNKNATNVIFTIADLEYEQIAYEEEFTGKTDFVVASFGMGSFIEDTSKMLRRFHEWLRPGGMLFLSMYNKNSVLLNLTPNWRDTSLSAHIDVDTSTLQVQLNSDTVFQIFCKPYDNKIKSEIAKKFDILNIYSYPTTLALLPNSLLKDNLAKELFSHIDHLLTRDKKFFLGHYVLLIAQKHKGADIDGYKNVISLLESKDIKFEIIEHDMVLSVDDVIREIGHQDGVFVKTLIFYDNDTKNFFVIALRHNRKLNKKAFAKYINVNNKKLKFATEKQVVEFGFPIGGIPPFGYPELDNIKFYIDESLRRLKDTIIFTGIGNNRMTLKLSSSHFSRLINEYLTVPEKLLMRQQNAAPDRYSAGAP